MKFREYRETNRKIEQPVEIAMEEQVDEINKLLESIKIDDEIDTSMDLIEEELNKIDDIESLMNLRKSTIDCSKKHHKSIEEGKYGYEGVKYGGEVFNTGNARQNNQIEDDLDELLESIDKNMRTL